MERITYIAPEWKVLVKKWICKSPCGAADLSMNLQKIYEPDLAPAGGGPHSKLRAVDGTRFGPRGVVGAPAREMDD